MSTIAVLFSGQGAQYQGMGNELEALLPNSDLIFNTGSEILGFDIKDTCFNADIETLANTEIAQGVIFTISMLSFEVLKSIGVVPNMVAGHSLGEYAAMVASNMITLEEGYNLIKVRSKAMGNCAKRQDGSMAAVLNVNPDELALICDKAEGYVVPVNYNSSVQTVVAGETSAVVDVISRLSVLGKKAVKLNVAAAFHSDFMQPAADEFFGLFPEVEFKAPTCEFYSNLSGEKMTDFSNMQQYLADHIVKPVRFTDELANMKAAGADVFIECGPSKILSGLTKKTLKEVSVFSIEDLKSFEKLKSSIE